MHNGTSYFAPLRSATATGLGTDGRVFSATAAGLAEASGTLHWKNSTLSVGTTTAQNARGIYASGQVRATQGVRLGTSGSAPWIFPYSTVPGSSDSTGLNLSFYSYSTAVPHAFGIVGEIVTATSGTGGILYVGKTFQPPSGTASWAAVDIMTGRSIIQTGGATGITRGVYVNPGLTNVFDYRGVETTNNVGKAFYQSGSNAVNNFAGNVNIGSILAPNRTLQVTGELRVTDLTTDAPTQIVGADADGDLGAVTLGTGLSFSSGTLNGAFLPLAGGTMVGNILFTDNTYDIGASGLTRPRTGYFGTSVISPIFNATTGYQIGGAATSGKILKANGTNFVASTETYAAPGSSGNVMTSDGTNWTSAAPASAVVNLSLTGTAQVIELTNSAGTDIVCKGVGIGLTKVTGTKDTLYFTRIEHWGEVSISGGSTAVTAATPERPDNDTPGTPTASLSSEFTQSGSTVSYIGAAGQAEVTGTVSFTTDAIGDYLVSLYQEGVELPVTEVRVSCLIGSYVTIPVITTSVNIATNDTFDLRIEPVSGSATITVHRYNVYARKIY